VLDQLSFTPVNFSLQPRLILEINFCNIDDISWSEGPLKTLCLLSMTFQMQTCDVHYCVASLNKADLCSTVRMDVIFLQRKLKEGYLTKAPDLTKGTSGFKVRRKWNTYNV